MHGVLGRVGKVLEVPARDLNQVELSLPDTEPVAVELALPTYRCPGCQKEVTLPKKSVERGVMQAVANAFRSANIPPG